MKKIKWTKSLLLLIIFPSLICITFFSYKYFASRNKAQIHLIGLGFPRAGTSVLFNELEKLPYTNRIYKYYDSEYKNYSTEPYFFGNQSLKTSVSLRKTEKTHTKKFKPPIKYYQHLLVNNAVNFEKSPQYIWKSSIYKEIYKFNPNVKIVVSLRHPVDWIYAYYKHCKVTKRYGMDDSTSFTEFLRMQQPESQVSMKDCALFSNYLKNIYGTFPRENIFIIAQEELSKIKDTQGICELFELPKPEENLTVQFHGPHSYRNEIGEELYAELLDFYYPHILELFELIGRPIPEWELSSK